MLKIKEGSTRIVFILFERLVIKIPNPRWDCLKGSKTPSEFMSRLYWALIYGLSSNLSEALLSSNRGVAEYLEPVFSICIANFQRYLGEDRPSQDEVNALCEGLCDDGRVIWYECNVHEKGVTNWRKSGGRMMLIDYGVDALRTPFARLLIYFTKRLNKLTTLDK